MADVLIVGAGAAGLMAANRLCHAGLSATVVEARDRIGGRALTATPDGWRQPVELGAEFVHDEARFTRELAAASVIGLARVPDRHGERQEGGGLRRMKDPWSVLTKLVARKADRQDCSALDFLRRVEHTAEEARILRMVVEGFDAAPVEDVSIESLREEWRSTSRIARLKGGYSALFEHVLATMPSGFRLVLEARVRRIAWGPRGIEAIVVTSEGERVELARFAIVTVPIGLLSSGSHGIGFDPPLPDLDARLRLVGMGQASRVVLRFSTSPWGLRNPGFVHDPSAPFPTVWGSRSGDQYQVTAWAGGRYALELRGLENGELESLALRSARHTLEIPAYAVSRAFLGAHHHDFQTDPASLGAYSYARPGAGSVRRDLARPFEHAVFLAGEATDDEQPGTVEGALSSGDRAARQILDIALTEQHRAAHA